MRTGGPAEKRLSSGALLREAVLCVWFVLTGAAFWGAFAGFSFAAPLTAFYGLFLVAVVVRLALRLLRRGNDSTLKKNDPRV